MQPVGVGPRAIASIIDLVVLLIISMCIFLLLGYGTNTDADPGDVPLRVNILGLVLGFLYFIIAEGTTGTTPGKRVLKLRVVRLDGRPYAMPDSFTRNVMRVVDGLFFNLVGAIFVWTSPRNQRLGDRLAGTIVVRYGDQSEHPDAEHGSWASR